MPRSIELRLQKLEAVAKPRLQPLIVISLSSDPHPRPYNDENVQEWVAAGRARSEGVAVFYGW